jgi:hypothetical protein
MLPDELQIGPHTVKVLKFDLRDQDAAGEAHVQTNEIHVRSGMSASQEVETLIHEISHFLLCPVALPDGFDECTAGVIGKGFTDFIRDNPVWVRRFLDVFKKEEQSKCQQKKQLRRAARKTPPRKRPT